MKGNKKNLLAVVAIVAFSVLGCGWMIEGKASGEKGAAEFHRMYNEGRYKAIYDTADKGFKDSASIDDLEKILSLIERRLGKAGESKTTNFMVKSTTEGSFVDIQMQTQYEKDMATESFTFRLDGDSAVLYSFNVNSKALMPE